MWAGREGKLKADEGFERADTSKRDSRCERQNKRRRLYFLSVIAFRSLFTRISVTALILFASRSLASRICPFRSQIFLLTPWDLSLRPNILINPMPIVATIKLNGNYQEIRPMNIRPLHDRVIVERQEVESKSAGGIVLTGSAAEKSTRGVILAVGKGRILENGSVQPLDVKVGDTVIFAEGYGTKTEKIDGKEVLIMSENDIMAIVE